MWLKHQVNSALPRCPELIRRLAMVAVGLPKLASIWFLAVSCMALQETGRMLGCLAKVY